MYKYLGRVLRNDRIVRSFVSNNRSYMIKLLRGNAKLFLNPGGSCVLQIWFQGSVIYNYSCTCVGFGKYKFERLLSLG